MKKRPRELATLTPEEDRAWVWTFNYFLDCGKTQTQADRLTWRDLCRQFPRLKKYDGCLPE